MQPFKFQGAAKVKAERAADEGSTEKKEEGPTGTATVKLETVAEEVEVGEAEAEAKAGSARRRVRLEAGEAKAKAKAGSGGKRAPPKHIRLKAPKGYNKVAVADRAAWQEQKMAQFRRRNGYVSDDDDDSDREDERQGGEDVASFDQRDGESMSSYLLRLRQIFAWKLEAVEALQRELDEAAEDEHWAPELEQRELQEEHDLALPQT